MKIMEEIKETFYKGKVNNIITVEKLCQKVDLPTENLLLEGDITFLKFIYNNKTLLVADRNLKNMISWDQLDEKDLVFGKVIEINSIIKYRVRLLTASEWDQLIIKYVPLNQDSHWDDIWSWCQNIYSIDYLKKYSSSDLTNHIIRGNSTVSYFLTGTSSYVNAGIGWRPCLELL